MKNKIVLAISIAVGLIAFWLTGQYLSSEREKLYRGAEKIEVLAALKDIPAGTDLSTADNIGKKWVYKSAVVENICRVEDGDAIRGKKLLFPLRAGEPLTWAYVEAPERSGGLASMIRPGLRAVSISVGGPSAVSGLVQPNDRVDILGTFSFPSRRNPQSGQMENVTLTVLQDVTVLATGSKLGKTPFSGGGAGGYNTVTLEVTTHEAELLVFAQHVKGQLLLTLRNPEDGSFDKTPAEIDFQQLEGKLPELNQYRQQYIRSKKTL